MLKKIEKKKKIMVDSVMGPYLVQIGNKGLCPFRV